MPQENTYSNSSGRAESSGAAKCLAAAVLIAAGAAAGFVAGRLVPGPQKNAADAAPAAAQDDSAKLEKATRRIAELERKLDAVKRSSARRNRKDSAKAAEAAADGAKDFAVSSGTNLDIVAELKKNLSEEDFDKATNAMTRITAKMSEKARNRMEFLRSVDTSAMTKQEREGHARFIELMEKREAVRSKMKFGIPDQKTLQELMEVELQIAPQAKAERAALSRELARELGYTGEDVNAVQEAVGNIIDCTSGELGGMMDAAEAMEGMPGVEIGTEVQVLSL